MQLPYIAHVMKSRKDQYTIVPIVVGGLSFKKQEFFGNLLSHYLEDEKNIFVISSDFCHWGKRFRYQYYKESDGEIWQSIMKLDHLQMFSYVLNLFITFKGSRGDTESRTYKIQGVS
ncbi:unnamed protein product [Trichobilharzia szidati]|nr:unnamed protein product [Trichobilharzia szidati]